MHISGLKQSKFLTRNDVGEGILVTIKELFQENVAKEGAPEELRYCLSFVEHEKPLVLNNTNGQIIAQITKSEETDTWPGHKIVCYDDPNVSFAGKLVGGIRVRAPRIQAPKPAAAPTHGMLGKPVDRVASAPAPQALAEPEAGPDPGDDVPFNRADATLP